MAGEPEPRGPHPCLERRCGHPDQDHLSTPELAGPSETVVWCVSCHRHEVHRHRRWGAFGMTSSRSRPLQRTSS